MEKFRLRSEVPHLISGKAYLGAAAVLLFTVSTMWANEFKVIHKFKSGSLDGQGPAAALVADPAGNLYGTTYRGGTSGCGTVFEMSPPVSGNDPWTEQIIYSFSQDVGCNPQGRLIFDNDGNLYGTTQNGGSNDVGAAFELSPPTVQGGAWTALNLFNSNNAKGQSPLAGLVMDKIGNLYGTTSIGGVIDKNCGDFIGCGLVFKLSPPAQEGGAWTETILHKFQGGNEGFVPASELVMDGQGNLYGTTAYGGDDSGLCLSAAKGCGTVFRLKPPSLPGDSWTEQILYRFVGGTSNGAIPNGIVLDDKGNLYGTAQQGGIDFCFASNFGCGVAFELSPPKDGNTWTESILYTFAGISDNSADGGTPDSSLVFDKAGNLYGVTETGGAASGCDLSSAICGTVFELMPPSSTGGTWTENVLQNFDGATQGSRPIGGLTFGKSGGLYGVTLWGGDVSCGCGTVFSLAP
jgi:uncharacterized repeat protein (TIGR03803 family)